MSWARILRAAGIPDSPGRQECIDGLVDRRLVQAREKEAAMRRADVAYLERLAAQGDTRKATRSKVRLGR